MARVTERTGSHARKYRCVCPLGSGMHPPAVRMVKSPFRSGASSCIHGFTRLPRGQSRGNHRVHVVVFVLAQTAAENDLFFPLRQRFVLCVQGAVFFVVYRIIRLVAGVPLAGVFPADDGFRQVIALLVLAEGEPLFLFFV